MPSTISSRTTQGDPPQDTESGTSLSGYVGCSVGQADERWLIAGRLMTIVRLPMPRRHGERAYDTLSLPCRTESYNSGEVSLVRVEVIALELDVALGLDGQRPQAVLVGGPWMSCEASGVQQRVQYYVACQR